MRSNNRAYYSKTALGAPLCAALGAMRTLAALLLADGRIVSAGDIATAALPWGGARGSVACWVKTLRSYGCRIETVYPHGFRLTALPPDELLDDVLVIAHQLRAEQPTRLWQCLGLERRPPTRLERREMIRRSRMLDCRLSA